MAYTIALIGNDTCDSTSATEFSRALAGAEVIFYEPDPMPMLDVGDYQLEDFTIPTPRRFPILERIRPRPVKTRAPIRLDGRGWH